MRIYTESGAPETPCFSTTNPFLSKTVRPTLVYNGQGIQQKNATATLERAAHGDATRNQSLSFSLFGNATIPLGSWAFTYDTCGNLINGQVVSRECVSPGVHAIEIDTLKVPPFSVEDSTAPVVRIIEGGSVAPADTTPPIVSVPSGASTSDTTPPSASVLAGSSQADLVAPGVSVISGQSALDVTAPVVAIPAGQSATDTTAPSILVTGGSTEADTTSPTIELVEGGIVPETDPPVVSVLSGQSQTVGDNTAPTVTIPSGSTAIDNTAPVVLIPNGAAQADITAPSIAVTAGSTAIDTVPPAVSIPSGQTAVDITPPFVSVPGGATQTDITPPVALVTSGDTQADITGPGVSVLSGGTQIDAIAPIVSVLSGGSPTDNTAPVVTVPSGESAPDLTAPAVSVPNGETQPDNTAPNVSIAAGSTVADVSPPAVSIINGQSSIDTTPPSVSIPSGQAAIDATPPNVSVLSGDTALDVTPPFVSVPSGQAAPALSLPVLSGLALHLDAGSGVTADGSGAVTAWADQSPQGNNFVGAGLPQVVAGGLNGNDYIAFDGIDDLLERTDTLNGFPSGGADRSIFFVVSYLSAGIGGFSYGNPSRNDAFGLVVEDDGFLGIQGWRGANNQKSTTVGVNEGWLVQSSILDAGVMTHWKDGVQIDTKTHNYTTILNQAIIGAELDRSPFVEMGAATVLVYDRALAEAERQQVETFLQDKYAIAGGA